MSYYNSKEYWKKKLIAENRLKKICPDLPNKSGIYMWYRNAEIKCYVGQARNLMDRSVQHLNQFDHLGNSIRTHGLYSKDKPFGWKLAYFLCDIEELNIKEKEEIAKALEKGYTLYNITSGGQDAGKTDINQRESGKTYTEGKKVGYQNAMREIKELFDKYLKVLPKDNDLKKDGNIKEIYLRKLKEFNELLANVDKEE